MKLTKAHKALIASYLRSILGAGLATYIPTHDWQLALNALWAAIVPVLLRWLNTADPAFGRKAAGSE